MKTLYNKNIFLLLACLAAFGCSSVGASFQKNKMYSSTTKDTASLNERHDDVICNWFREYNSLQPLLTRDVRRIIQQYANYLTLYEKLKISSIANEYLKKFNQHRDNSDCNKNPPSKCMYKSSDYSQNFLFPNQQSEAKGILSRIQERGDLDKLYKVLPLCTKRFSIVFELNEVRDTLEVFPFLRLLELLKEFEKKTELEFAQIEEMKAEWKRRFNNKYSQYLDKFKEVSLRVNICKEKFSNYKGDTFGNEKQALIKLMDKKIYELVKIEQNYKDFKYNEKDLKKLHKSLFVDISNIEGECDDIILNEDKKLTEFGIRLDEIIIKAENYKCINSMLKEVTNTNHKKWHKQTTTKLKRLIIMGGDLRVAQIG